MNRSLWLAILACLAMYFYAKAPLLLGGQSWISYVFFVAVLAISSWGMVSGIKAARRERRLWAWLAPAINAFLLISFLAFFLLTVYRLKNM